MMQWLMLFLLLSHGESVSFKTQDIVFNNGVKLKAEMAVTPQQRAQGLMYRTQLAAGNGMLFVFDREEVQDFWMKNTFISLSIGFFDKNKKLLEILDMEPPQGPVRDDQLPRYASQKSALYALEVPKGWFAKQKIKPGATFTIRK